MNLQYDGQITIAHAASCKATKWRNVQTTWGALLGDLMTTTRTSETLDEYARMSKDERNRISDKVFHKSPHQPFPFTPVFRFGISGIETFAVLPSP